MLAFMPRSLSLLALLIAAHSSPSLLPGISVVSDGNGGGPVSALP